MLSPHWIESHTKETMRDKWQRTRNLRLTSLFEPQAFQAVYQALPFLPFSLAYSSQADFGYRYWKAPFANRATTHASLQPLIDWLLGPGTDWVAELTHSPIQPPQWDGLAACLFTKGSYLERHNDRDGSRAIAFVIGLTPETWPAQDGGHLRFYASDSAPHFTEERPPGYNTLDLFDVEAGACWHSVSMLRHHRQRYTLSGWFHSPAPSPSTRSSG